MSPRARFIGRYAFFGLLLTILAATLLWPIALTVVGAFAAGGEAAPGSAPGSAQSVTSGGALSYFFGPVGVLRDPLYLQGFVNSLLIATVTTLVCLVLTLPMAILSARYEFPLKNILGSFVLVPLILPPFVGAIGMRAILGRYGSLNALLWETGLASPGSGFDLLGGARFWGVVITEALHFYPILYLNIVAALANLDPALDEAAQNLGSGPWRRLWRITFPLILPGVFAGGTIVFIGALTELGTPLMFNLYTTTPVQIYWGLQEVSASPRPYALVVVMLILSVALYAVGKLVIGGRAYAMQSRASIAAKPPRLTGAAGLGATALFFVLIGVAVLPHIGVVISSFAGDGSWYGSVLPKELTLDHYSQALSHKLSVGSIRNSLVYATLAMVLCVILGVSISYMTTRVRVRGAWLLDGLAMLPLAVPGLVMAFGYVAMTLRWPFPDLQAFFLSHKWTTAAELMAVTGTAPNPLLILVIAYAVRRLPYVVRSVSAGLEQTSVQMEEASLNLGASMATTLRRITLPLVAANLIAGGLLAFSFAMLEVSDSLILAQKEQHYPITKAIFTFYERLGDGPYIASAMGVWGMALLTVTLVGAGLIMGKKMGAIFKA
jgi:iron(III) transport system permease protein